MTTYTWLGSGSEQTGAWGTAANWSPGGVPGASDAADIDSGTATDDVNQPQFLPDDTINPGDEVGTLNIGVDGALVIGDAAGANSSNFTVIGQNSYTDSFVLGSLVINEGSTFYLSAFLGTSVSGVAQTGTITIRGELLAQGDSEIFGGGPVELDGGVIDDTGLLSSSVIVSGVGAILATGQPITFNFGTIDATNLHAGANYFYITDGLLYNYGTLEATNSVAGSTGYAVLEANSGAVIVAGGKSLIAVTKGAYMTLESIKTTGEVLVNGGYMTFASPATTTGQDYIENGGTLTFDASMSVAGYMTIYAGSEVTGTGMLKTSFQGANGEVYIDKGTLFVADKLSLWGNGGVVMEGGEIEDSSRQPVDTLINEVTISGAGDIDAYNVYSGKAAYNGLDTSNYSTIDATNIDSGLNVLGISGGVLYNYGSLEANDSNSGVKGTADLMIELGAVVVNTSTGVMSSGSGAEIELYDGTIKNGVLHGTLSVHGSENLIISSSATPYGFFNKGTIHVYGALAVNSTARSFNNNDARIEVDAGGTMILKGSLDGSSGAIAVDGGTFTSETDSSILDNLGHFVVGENGSGGSATLDRQLLLGSGLTSIDSGYLTLDAAATSQFYDNGVLAIGSGGAVTGYVTLGANGAIDIDTQTFNSSLTGTYYQASATTGLLTVSGQGYEISGDYQTVGKTTTFGAGGGPSGFAIQADVNNHNVEQVYR